MGNFSNFSITDKGRILFSDVQAGAVLVPTKIVIGSGTMASGTTPAMMTAVVSPVKELIINKRERTPDGKAVFGGMYSNRDVTASFYYRELALYCKAEYRDANGSVTRSLDEVLYAYGNSGTSADLMPAYDTNAVVEKQIDVLVWVGNDAAVELTVESGILVTQAQLAAAIAAIDTSIPDISTGRKYKFGIENGVVYLEEVS